MLRFRFIEACFACDIGTLPYWIKIESIDCVSNAVLSSSLHRGMPRSGAAPARNAASSCRGSLDGLASLHAAGYLPQIWTPDADTERSSRRGAIKSYGVALALMRCIRSCMRT